MYKRQIYINKVEEASDMASITHLLRQAEYQYTNMVKEQKEQLSGTGNKEKNPHVRRCNDYIFSHLHDRITIQAVSYTHLDVYKRQYPNRLWESGCS